MSPLDYLGVRIDTIVNDNVSIRCDGCLEVIDGTPWRMNILDTVAAETPVSWAERPQINPGPFEFHGEASHVRAWMRARGYLFCRKGAVREIMRPIPIQGRKARPCGTGCATASTATTTSSCQPDVPEPPHDEPGLPRTGGRPPDLKDRPRC